MKRIGHSLASQSGQVALLPMIMFVAFSAMMVFGYLAISQNVLGRMNSKREAEQTIDNVINRVSNLMAIRDGTSCDPGIMSAILNIRNLANTNAVTFSKTFVAVTSPSLLTINCVLEKEEATKLVKMNIKFVSLPSDQDLQQLSRTVKITVTGQSTRYANNITVERLMRIRVANLSQHALVLWGTNTKNKIDLDAGTSLEVDGTTMVAVSDVNTPFTFSGFVSGLGLPYNGAVIFRKSVFTNSIYSSIGADALLQKQLVAVFNQGLQTNFMSAVPLPIFSGSDPIYSGVDAVWQNNIDYEYVFNGIGMAPLPEYPSYTSMNDSAHLYSSKGAGTKIPNNNITQNISDTCRGLDDDQGSISAMVFLQKDKNVVLDFTSSIEDAGTGNDVFCGLVMAKTLTVRLRKDTRIYGHFFVGKLKIEGAGKLQIVDPESASDIILPGVGHGFDLLRRQLLGLQVFIGQAFYVPLAYNPSTTFASHPKFVPQPIYKLLEAGLNPTWPTLIESPVRTNDPDKDTDAKLLFKSGAGQQNLVFSTEVIL